MPKPNHDFKRNQKPLAQPTGPSSGLVEHLLPKVEPDEIEIVDRFGGNPGISDAYETASWADLEERNAKVRYLLRHWIPCGMLTGLIGEPKVGKTSFVLWAIIRPIITGCAWFTGQSGSDPSYVLWCDTERRSGLNLPRAREFGLPVERVLLPFKQDNIYGVLDMNDDDHINRIKNVVFRYQAKLVIVDGYRGANKKNEDKSDCALGLLNLARICEETGCALIILHHTGKLAKDQDIDINSGRGSNAFLASVIAQLAIDIPDPADNPLDSWRRLQVLGENLGIAPNPRGFRIHTNGLEFGAPPMRPTKEEKEKRQTGKNQAVWFLKAKIRPGEWCDAGPILKHAMAEGLSPTGTLEQAKDALGIVSKKEGKGWKWFRPGPVVNAADSV